MSRKILLALSLICIFTACTTPDKDSTLVVQTITTTATPLGTATLKIEIYKDPSYPLDARVEDLLSRMTLEEKIGQMTQVEKDSIQPGDISKYYIGSILSGGGGSPPINTPESWVEMVQGFQNEALATRLGIPLIYGVDAVHGHNNLKDATIFPQNIGLGAANDRDLTCRIAQATAQEMLATGVTWDFAPVVAVPQDIRWGRTYEGYSENTEIVASLGNAYIGCLQQPQENISNKPTVVATSKHFIGDGGTIWGSSRTSFDGRLYKLDQGTMQVDENTMRELYLPPYKAAVEAGVKSVMASFSSWRGTKMHAQKYLLTNVLKDELGFDGFIVSDWQAIDQINPKDYYSSVVTAINAGVDMNMVPYDYVKFITTMKKAVEEKDIPEERIDDAVRRILRVKFETGLFEQPVPDVHIFQNTIRSDEHLALAREAVRKSLVLLKNDHNALPVAKDAPIIFVTGSGANAIGIQSGGWTMTWQGEIGAITEGTTLLNAIQDTVGEETQVIFDKSGNFEKAKDASGNPLRALVGIVVVGEKPYAEGVGDSSDLALPATDIKIVKNIRERVDNLIVVILSGRPVIIADILPEADAVVAAWLPGTEGAGVTDVLFGDYPFTGRLPYTWPRSVDQLPLNMNTVGDKNGCDGSLFPFGYGLEIGDPSPEILECK
jgi:beta-glucosidase